MLSKRLVGCGAFELPGHSSQKLFLRTPDRHQELHFPVG